MAAGRCESDDHGGKRRSRDRCQTLSPEGGNLAVNAILLEADSRLVRAGRDAMGEV